MVYSKSYTQTTSFSSIGNKTTTSENVFMFEKMGKKSRFLRQIGKNGKSRSIVGYTPDGKEVSILSQKVNGPKVKYDKFVIKSPKNLKEAFNKSLNMSDIKSHVIKKGKGTKVKKGKGTKGKKGKGSKRVKVAKKTKGIKPHKILKNKKNKTQKKRKSK